MSIIGLLVEDFNVCEHNNVRSIGAVFGASPVPLLFHLFVEQGDRVDDTPRALLNGRLQVRTYGSVDLLTGANGSGLHQGKATSNGDLNSHRNRFVCHHGTAWQTSNPIAFHVTGRTGKRTSPPTRTLARHKTICDEAKPPLQQLPSTHKLPVERRTKPPSSISDGPPTTMHLRDVQRSVDADGACVIEPDLDEVGTDNCRKGEYI